MMRKIIISGALANKPHNGGEAWVRLSWVLGFRRLGFHVYFLEQISRKACIDASGGASSDVESSTNLAWFREVTERFGLAGASALIDVDSGRTFGLSESALRDVTASAELLVNISGHLSHGPVMAPIRCKAFVDIDPGFTQFWHAQGNAGARLAGHDYFFTIGANIGSLSCPIPTGGIQWRPVRQPVVLEDWPVCTEGDRGRFTTVASWRGPFGPVQAGGKTYGLKVHEFRKYLDLPTRSCPPADVFEIALDIHPGDHKDRDNLRAHGWNIVEPRDVASGPESFRRYVQLSGAEFSAAQGVYVHTNSGWFSDRTVRYLASGKPALVQDSGFGRQFPTGNGLVPFRTPDEAIAGVGSILADYERHSRAARAIAEEFFDSDKVIADMLRQVS